MKTAIERSSLAILLLAVGCMTGYTQTYINVDFQPGGTGGGTSENFAAQGALLTPGTTWNIVAPSTDGVNNSPFGSGGNYDFSGDPYTVNALLDSSGVATPVGVEIYKGDPDGAFALNPLNGFETNIADNARELMRDYLISGWATEPVAVNITGIPAGSYFVLYLYGAGDNSLVSTEFTVNGVVGSTTGVPDGSHDLTIGEDYVAFSSIATNGTIVITFKDAGETVDGHFNGFQLAYSDSPNIPTLGEWGMILLACLIVYAGWRRFRPVPASTEA